MDQDVKPYHVTMLIAALALLGFAVLGAIVWLKATGNQIDGALYTALGTVLGALTTLAVNRSRSTPEQDQAAMVAVRDAITPPTPTEIRQGSGIGSL